MTTNSLRNIRILLCLFFCFRMTPFIYAGEFLFTTINASQGLSDNQIRYILQLPDGRMVFTTSGNVNLYDGVHFSYLHRTTEYVYPLNQYNGHYRIYQSGDSLLWIKDTHKLMCIDLYREEYIPDLDAYFKNREIQAPVEDLFVDDSGHIWLLIANELLELNNKTRITLPGKYSGKLQDLNADSTSLYLFYDTGEVSCYHIADQKTVYNIAAYPASEQAEYQNTSLVVKSADGFYQLRNGRKGGLFYFNSHKRTWKKLFEQNYTLNTLIITPNGEKAYISCVHGFWMIDLHTGTQKYIPLLETGNGQIVSTEISTIFQDRQGGLWLGTFNRGLLYHHPSMHKLTHIGRNAFPVSPEEEINIESFAEDKDGNIYLKAHSRIYRLTANEQKSYVLKSAAIPSVSPEILNRLNPNKNHHFRNKVFNTLYTDTRGWTWAGTPDGLELFTSENDSAPRIFYRENGLSNNFIQGIIEDKYRDIWVTTSNGVTRIHINPENKNISFTRFNQLDGALDGEYIKDAVFSSSDGTLYLGGIDGFSIFHPDKDSIHPMLPDPPVFTALRLYGEKVNTGKEYGNRIILSKAAPYTTEIELDYNQNFLTFEFSALNYINHERTYYRYQLEGIDPQWMSTFAGRQGNATVGKGLLQAVYTNLPPGDYTFKVMASDNPLQWNGKVTAIKLTIHAPWWKTTTAYILYAVILLLIAFTGIRLYIYWSRKEMERKHKEEILLLRIRNLIEQNNSLTCGIEETSPDHQQQDTEESAFLAQAIKLVEQNLHVNGYSVEQLSRDLCMERTGLYRKLVTMLDQSPSLFIRNIRLQRAAQLITEGKLSITEIAEHTGFSSSSYLSKCFQEMYGCRPSEYAEKAKEST